jgi:uncharacterized protein (TIGR02444 family)
MTSDAVAAGDRNSPFWQFSLALYARPGVAAACIELQDDAGVDVNVMFYVLYLARQLRQIDRVDAAHIDASIKAWREIAVVPLRTLRRRLKSGIEPIAVSASETLRSAIKRIELDAERIEQEWLEGNVPAATLGTQATSPLDAARTNLTAYGALLTVLPDAPVATVIAAFGQQIDA